MFVVGRSVDGDADACLVGFTSQCSIEPPRFAVFLSKIEPHLRARVACDRRWSCTASEPDQHDLAEHFGGTTAHDDPGKLATWPWERRVPTARP